MESNDCESFRFQDICSLRLSCHRDAYLTSAECPEPDAGGTNRRLYYPTAYVVYSAKGQFFSHPAVGYHFVDAEKVIGNVHTFSIAEGFANRAEVGYTPAFIPRRQRGVQQPVGLPGMNIFSEGCGREGRAVGPWMPGVGAGFVVRTDDRLSPARWIRRLPGR